MEIIKKIIKYVCSVIGDAFLKLHSVEVMNSLQTIQYIVSEKCSIARFGDGEFNLIFKNRDIGFQTFEPTLGIRLSEVLRSNDRRCLVCVPKALTGETGMTKRASDFWQSYFSHRKIKIGRMLLRSSKCKYGNSCVTRPYMDFEDKEYSRAVFQGIMQIIKDRDILIVEGEQSRSGVGNNLFQSAKSVERILCPARNAWKEYENILESAKKYGNQKLILIALGPTATVLAYGLSQLDGYQALDIGHLDVEYEWYRMGANEKCHVQGRNVNEVGGGIITELNEEALKKYEDEIVCRIEVPGSAPKKTL